MIIVSGLPENKTKGGERDVMNRRQRGLQTVILGPLTAK